MLDLLALKPARHKLLLDEEECEKETLGGVLLILNAPGRSVTFIFNMDSVFELHLPSQIQGFWPTKEAWSINRNTLKSQGGTIRAREIYPLVRRITC